MKRLHYLISVLFFLSLAFSMTAQDKYFKEALKRGRGETGFYRAVIEGNKKVSYEQLKEKCRKYDYILIDFKNKYVQHFGKEETSVGSFQFLPQNEVDSYVFSNLRFAYQKYDDLKQEGAAMLPFTFPIKELKTIQVLWSGNVFNGKVDGNGFGYGILPGTKTAICFSGKMKDGFPQGDMSVRIANISDIASIVSEKHDFSVSDENDGLFRYSENSKFGYFDRYGKVAMPSQFTQASNFSDGKAVVSKPKSQFHFNMSYKGYVLNDINTGNSVAYIIDTQGNFIDFTPSQKTQFDKRIAAIEEQKEKERLERLEQERQEELRRQQEEQERIAREKRYEQERIAEEKRIKAEEAKKKYHKKPLRETCIGCWGRGCYTTQVFDDDGGFWYNKTSICILCNGKGYTETHYY